MARRVARLTLDTLSDLPESVRSCLFWELDPVRRERVEHAGAAESEKEAWLTYERPSGSRPGSGAPFDFQPGVRSALRSWSIGRTNAAVLPVPVWAPARRSRPARTRGIDSRWTGVGSV